MIGEKRPNTKYIAAPPHSMCQCCGDGASPLGEVEDVMSQQSGKSPHQGLVACVPQMAKTDHEEKEEARQKGKKSKAAGSLGWKDFPSCLGRRGINAPPKL